MNKDKIEPRVRLRACQYDAQIEQLYRALYQAQPKSLLERLDWISGRFLGKPYVLGAQGEGEQGQFDQMPLYQLDAFDCITFCSTVLALLQSTDVASFKKNIVKVSYHRGQVDFIHRNHFFVCIDWNIDNASHGFIKEITPSIVDHEQHPIYQLAKAQIDKPNWIQHFGLQDLRSLQPMTPSQAQELLSLWHSQAQQLQVLPSEIPYLPLSALLDTHGQENSVYFDQFPPVLVLNIVRPNWDIRDTYGTCLNISHLGFVLRLKGELRFRHASSIEKKVVDVSLIDYLKVNCLPKESIQGVNLQQILDTT